MFYVKDFSCDGVVEAMSTEAVGAYILLLCKAWYENPPGSIPNDDQVLARWARTDATRWAECRAAVLAAFTLGGDGRFHQKRLRLEFDKQRANSSKRSEAGEKGAQSRWQTHGKRIAMPMANDGLASAFPLPNTIPPPDDVTGGVLEVTDAVPKPKPPPKPLKEPDIPVSLNSEPFRKAWADWRQHRTEIRHKLTPTQSAKQLSKLEEMGAVRAIAAIEFSIRNGWQGIFEETGKGGAPVKPAGTKGLEKIRYGTVAKQTDRWRREQEAERAALQAKPPPTSNLANILPEVMP